jgi:outer membrane protein assembly factor BamB
MRRTIGLFGLVLALALLLPASGVARSANVFPEIVPLPNGFQPEGIVVGYGTELFAGSLATGAIYEADLRSGQGDILVPGQEGRVAAGLAFDARTGYLYVSGGPTGMVYVYDTRTGQEVASFSLAGPGNFINDAEVTRTAVYFTSSFEAVLYKVPLLEGGLLPDPIQVQALPLSGDWEQVPGAGVFNANGIDATPNGKTLIVVNSELGTLYRVNPNTGEADLIDLGGDTVVNGDGILLDGKTLYVVRNADNLIAVVELAPNLASGTIATTISNPAFRVPTTIDELGHRLYVVNARFDVANPGPDTEYEVVRVIKP